MELDFGLGIGARSSAGQKQPSLAVTHRGGSALPKAKAMSTAMQKGRHHQARPSSPRSALSSFSTVYTPAVKTENEFAGYQDNDCGAKKKLRLTKGQSALLEDKFKEHTTLSPKQKHALAKQLNLQPRQVDVWFQNRRARTKVKQTQEDCELLKKCCESLTEENRRLLKELQELECSLKFAQMPVYMQFPAATLITICSSCKTIAGARQR